MSDIGSWCHKRRHVLQMADWLQDWHALRATALQLGQVVRHALARVSREPCVANSQVELLTRVRYDFDAAQ